MGHMGRRAESPEPGHQMAESPHSPTPPPPPAGRLSSPTPLKCDSTLSMQHVLFTILVKKPQNLLPALLNLRASILSGSRAGVASPSGLPRIWLRHPCLCWNQASEHTGHPSEGGYFFLGSTPACRPGVCGVSAGMK